MRIPTLVPYAEYHLICFVHCDWPEVWPVLLRSQDQSDRETDLQWIQEGHYNNPIEILEVIKAAAHAVT